MTGVNFSLGMARLSRSPSSTATSVAGKAASATSHTVLVYNPPTAWPVSVSSPVGK